MALSNRRIPMQTEEEYYFTGKELIPAFPYQLFDNNSGFLELPFDPYVQWRNKLTPRFLELLMLLPKEIRHMIYNEVIFLPCVVDYDNWRTYHWRKSYYFDYSEETPPPSFAIQRFGKPLTFVDSEKYEDPDRSWDWHGLAMDVWSHKRGQMEHFQGYHEHGSSRNIEKYKNAVGFTIGLACAEGWQLGEKPFWTSMKVNHLWLHANMTACRRVENLSLTFQPQVESFLPHQGDSMAVTYPSNKNFLRICNLVAETLPNLQTLRLWIWLSVRKVEDVLANPGAQRWLAGLKKILVWQKLDLQLLIGYSSYWEVYEEARFWDEEKKQAVQDMYQENLRLIMMPDSLSYGTTLDVPDDLGFSFLFSDGV